jgi:hypothetical protein
MVANESFVKSRYADRRVVVLIGRHLPVAVVFF